MIQIPKLLLFFFGGTGISLLCICLCHRGSFPYRWFSRARGSGFVTVAKNAIKHEVCVTRCPVRLYSPIQFLLFNAERCDRAKGEEREEDEDVFMQRLSDHYGMSS
jgi:hypothetical protein